MDPQNHFVRLQGLSKVFDSSVDIRNNDALEIMVEVRELLLQAEIIIDLPLDIVHDKQRLKEVENGLAKAITTGLYQQGVEFKVSKINFKLR